MGVTQGAADARAGAEIIAAFPLPRDKTEHAGNPYEHRLAVYRGTGGDVLIGLEYRRTSDDPGRWWTSEGFELHAEDTEPLARVLLGREAPAVSFADIGVIEQRFLPENAPELRVQCIIARELRLARVALERRNILLERRNATLTDSVKAMQEAEQAHDERMAKLASGGA